jgi:ACS family D-galactonate transporter-like MFS transporter
MTGASASTSAARHSADVRRWTIVGLLSLGMVIAYVSRSNLSVVLVLPDFVKSFHLSDTDRGTLNSAFFWA